MRKGTKALSVGKGVHELFDDQFPGGCFFAFHHLQNIYPGNQVGNIKGAAIDDIAQDHFPENIVNHNFLCGILRRGNINHIFKGRVGIQFEPWYFFVKELVGTSWILGR